MYTESIFNVYCKYIQCILKIYSMYTEYIFIVTECIFIVTESIFIVYLK